LESSTTCLQIIHASDLIGLVVTCQGVETKDPSHFITDHNIERLRQAKEANRVQVTSEIFLSPCSVLAWHIQDLA
jgi:hypothetical protein